MINFKKITTFGDMEIDPETGECYGVGDYYSVKLIDMATGKIVVSYGDCYHDKGMYKLEGFYDGLRAAGVVFTVIAHEELDEFA